MSIYDEYNELSERYRALYGQDTVVLMEVGSFMEFYDCGDGRGADVRRVCDILNVQATRKNKAIVEVSRTNPGFGGVPRVTLVKYVPLLVDAGYTVVIVVQVQEGQGGKISRRVSEVISASTAAASTLLDHRPVSDDAINLSSVYVEVGEGWSAVGWALLDISTGRSKAGQVLCADSRAEAPLDVLRAEFMSETPREVLVIGHGPRQLEPSTYDRVTSHVLSASTSLSTSHGTTKAHDMTGPLFDKRWTAPVHQNDVLRRAFPASMTGHLTAVEYANLERTPFALTAFVAVLSFAYDHNDLSLREVRRPDLTHDMDLPAEEFSRSGIAPYMTLSSDALRQLDVISVRSDQSLLKTLSCAVTSPGRRAFKERLLRPLTDPVEIQRRYGAIDSLLARPELLATLRKRMREVRDIERLFRRACYGRLAPHEIITFAADLSVCASLLRQAGAEVSPFASEAAKKADIIAALISDTFDAEAANRMSLDDMSSCNVFRRGTHPDMDELQDKSRDARADAERIAESLNSLAGSSFVRVVLDGTSTISTSSLELIVTAKRWSAIEAKIDRGKANIDSDDHRHHAEIRAVPTTGANVSLKSNKISMISTQYGESTTKLHALNRERYVVFLVEVLAKHSEGLSLVSDAVSELDVGCAAAHNAIRFAHTRPRFSEVHGNSGVRAKQMRHPIIEVINEREPYVPNDVSLGFSDDEPRGLLLYGVNAVGKSSVMKALGLCVIMAQAGFFVPCTEFELRGPFTELMTRIGLHDDLGRGRSTFVCEMTELRAVMRRATPTSLVIGDELCAGTETQSAMAIVGTGVRLLSDRRSIFVFATHLHELTSLSAVAECLSSNRVVSMHLSSRYDPDKSTLVLDRKLTPGQGLATYGLEVLKSLDMSSDFMALAERLRKEVAGVSGDLLDGKKSRYNRKVIVRDCSVCGKPATETHHVRPQALADARGMLPASDSHGPHHKNRMFNLQPLCSSCHDDEHSVDKTR